VDLRWRNKLVDLRPGRDHVEVVVETPDGRYRARCQYLLAADGSHSTVREKLGAKDAVSALSEDFWCISDVRMRRHESTVRKVFLDNPHNEGGAIWYHQMADNVWRTDWQVSHYPNPTAAATEKHLKRRLRGLLGAKAKFDVIWVGPWRFRRRYLERMVHGRVIFMGDAAAQHSPFGARGGNRAVQDANNLGWKLALVLAGKAAPDLVASYEVERHQAAREAVEIASRSATFIGPESESQQLIRDATLELAQRHDWARELVNVGRLSTACTYVQSPLNREKAGERAAFNAPLAMPGAAAPDGRIAGDGYLVDKLQGRFTVVYFGGEGARAELPSLSIPLKDNEELCARYGALVRGATYVFRPDGHALARCLGIDSGFAREAVDSVMRFRAGAPGKPVEAPPTIHDRDRLYDEFAAVLDGVPKKQREHALAQLAMALAYRLPPAEAAAAAAAAARARGPRGGRQGARRR
jgi:3-(3-hydroxy-phenyl)propionate hydroxylase